MTVPSDLPEEVMKGVIERAEAAVTRIYAEDTIQNERRSGSGTSTVSGARGEGGLSRISEPRRS
jgi:hypothetical protein